MTSAKFTCKVSLHEGPNAIECVINDLAGMTTSEKIWITADYTPPAIHFDSIPLKSNKERIKISGSVKDKFFATLKVSNPNILVDCNLQENKFDFDWPLDMGQNTLIVNAADLAGNQTIDTISVLYSGIGKGGDTVKTYNEMRGIIAKLEQENSILKQRIITCEQSAKNETNISDLNKNRYIIYKIKKDETLYFISQKFYGRMNLYWKIAEFNNLKEKDELVPGKEIKIPIIDDDLSKGKVSDSLKGKFDNIHTTVGHIRVSPNNNAALAGVLIKGDPVEILEKKDDWYRIQTNQGVTGWIHKEILGR
jgi:LysM repeat protein